MTDVQPSTPSMHFMLPVSGSESNQKLSEDTETVNRLFAGDDTQTLALGGFVLIIKATS